MLPTEVYMQRRAAAGEVWRQMAPGTLDMDQWSYGGCYCALGALAAARHDGWRWYSRHMEYPVWVNPDGRGPIDFSTAHVHASEYFGISAHNVVRLFGPNAFSAEMCGISALKPTGAQVADALMRLPVWSEEDYERLSAARRHERERAMDRLRQAMTGSPPIEVTVEPSPVLEIQTDVVVSDRYTRLFVEAPAQETFVTFRLEPETVAGPPISEPPDRRPNLIELFGLGARRLRALVGA